MATAQKNFRRMMRWLKGRDDIEITTYRELDEDLRRRKEADHAGRAAGDRAKDPRAQGARSERRPFAGRGLRRPGPGDHRLSGERDASRGPEAIHPLGPIGGCSPDEPGDRPPEDRRRVRTRAPGRRIRMRRAGPPGGTCRPGARASARARSSPSSAPSISTSTPGRPGAAYDVPAFEPYPKTNEPKIVAEIEGYKTWPVHKPTSTCPASSNSRSSSSGR
ncbi:MAG: hypothetical protein MZU84_09520 [Sphingobacterium sp.]|nr:hypothetical protein [Sphingobacterium sp.]